MVIEMIIAKFHKLRDGDENQYLEEFRVSDKSMLATVYHFVLPA